MFFNNYNNIHNFKNVTKSFDRAINGLSDLDMLGKRISTTILRRGYTRYGFNGRIKSF